MFKIEIVDYISNFSCGKADCVDQDAVDAYYTHILSTGMLTPNKVIIDGSEAYSQDDVVSTEEIEGVTYVTLKQHSVTTTDITAQVAQQERTALLAKEGARAKGCCDKVLNVVRGYNLTLTDEQVDTISAAFSSIFSLLSAGHPNRSKTAITAITPDALVTQELKDDILAVFTRWGF